MPFTLFLHRRLAELLRRTSKAWVVAALVATPALARDKGVEIDAELVFGVDISYSMNRQEQELQREGYVRALTSPDFLAALKAGATGKVAIAYMQWASHEDQDVLLDWTLIDGPDSAKAAADKLAEAPYRRARRTSISGGVDRAASLFDDNGFKGARQIIDISGDGPNNDGRPIVEARRDALAKGYVINGLPLVGIRDYLGPADIKDLDIYYEDCVVGGPGSFMIAVRDARSFVEATRNKLVREIAALPTQPIVKAQASAPRISCTIGESLWGGRGYRN